jgi:hypothetical protein
MPFTHFAKNNKFCPNFLAVILLRDLVHFSHILQLGKAKIVAKCVCFC